jgi:hypothetical protein
MAWRQTATVLMLGAREARTLDDERGATLRVTRGTIWLTQEDVPADVILHAGDSFLVEHEGAPVLESQEAPAVVCMTASTEALPRRASSRTGRERWRRRLAAWLAGPVERPRPYL